jgi:PhnB protein
MLTDENLEWGHKGPQTLGATTVSILLYLENVDARFKQAIDAGAKEMRPLQNQFWGDRMGTLTDPFGHIWSLATHIEDVSDAEMHRRGQEMMQKMAQQQKPA